MCCCLLTFISNGNFAILFNSHLNIIHFFVNCKNFNADFSKANRIVGNRDNVFSRKTAIDKNVHIFTF